MQFVVQNSQVRSSSTHIRYYYYDLLAAPAAVFGGEDKLLKKSSGWMLNELKLRLSLFKKRDIDKWKEGKIKYDTNDDDDEDGVVVVMMRIIHKRSNNHNHSW